MRKLVPGALPSFAGFACLVPTSLLFPSEGRRLQAASEVGNGKLAQPHIKGAQQIPGRSGYKQSFKLYSTSLCRESVAKVFCGGALRIGGRDGGVRSLV